MKRLTKLAAVALLATGCTTAPMRELWREKAGPPRVAYTGAGVTLGEFGKPGVLPDAYVRRTAELLTARRQFSAQQYVLRYPDVAADVLKSTPPGAPAEAMAFITKIASERGSHEAVEAQLQQSESLRQSGKANEAIAAWSQAARIAAENLSQQPTTMNPALWERLAALRPIEAKWPTEVQASLARAASGLGIASAEGLYAECLLWLVAGRWHFERSEAHAAVAAYKRAEVLTTEPIMKEHLRIRQAQALVAIGQESTATSILVNLTTHENPAIAGPATATLGALKLHGGAAQQARPLLEKALATPDIWPGRPEAMGDFAITMLLLGNEPAGVDQLHAAQSAFQAAGDTRGMLRAMNNEAEYWAAKGAEPRAAQVREQMAQIEMGASVVPAGGRNASAKASGQKPNLFEMPFEFRPRPR